MTPAEALQAPTLITTLPPWAPTAAPTPSPTDPAHPRRLDRQRHRHHSEHTASSATDALLNDHSAHPSMYTLGALPTRPCPTNVNDRLVTDYRPSQATDRPSTQTALPTEVPTAAPASADSSTDDSSDSSTNISFDNNPSITHISRQQH